jgi:alanyl-tRNA synthetase
MALRSEIEAIDRMKAKHASKLAIVTQALETKTSTRLSDVEDCKVLLKTMMDEEKATRAAKNDLQKQVMSLKEQVAQLTTALSRLKDENSKLASRASADAMNERIHTLRIASEIQTRSGGREGATGREARRGGRAAERGAQATRDRTNCTISCAG